MKQLPFVLLLACLASVARAEEQVVAHRLDVVLQPDKHALQVTDELRLPASWPARTSFLLHAGLEPASTTQGVKLARVATQMPLERWSVELPQGVRCFTLRYGGRIHHALALLGREYARSFRQTPGLIDKQGAYLSSASYWFPRFDQELVTFRLEVRLPAEFDVVSQGKRTVHELREGSRRVVWEEQAAQDDIYLIAGRFHEYARQAGSVQAMAFLRAKDPSLAARYLEATASYLELYGKLIGPYPYAKFALVENFWETGYGMPSFTLLGPKVIRLPFILHSSYPHEILHNWWGNGVYVDYERGNWCEGLTAYLADHLIKEQRGQAAEYRRATLQGYTDYAAEGRDFPLARFRSRHSAATQAVGYGKCLMLFHMLRLRVGDERFVEGLRRFYRAQRGKRASFDDLRRAFGAGEEFTQWVERAGAPELRIADVQVREAAGKFVLGGRIEQVQPGAAYRLQVPLAVWLEGGKQVLETRLSMKEKSLPFELTFDARPLRVRLDPRFDLFRKLDRREIPPALSQAFGARRATIVLPAAAPAPLLAAYRGLARVWSGTRSSKIEVVLDTDLQRLPAGRAVWLLGWENRFREQVAQALREYGATLDELRLDDSRVRRDRHSAVIVVRRPNDPKQPLAYIATANAAAVPGLARKLPHYGKYSYLAFAGDAPDNVAKGQWEVTGAPTTIDLGGRPAAGARLAPRAPLATLPPPFDAGRMLRDIRFLAAPEQEGRGFGTAGLDRAADYIARQLQAAGLQPGGEDGWFQRFEAEGGQPRHKATLRNVIAVLPGSFPAWRRQIVCLTAHYDHLGRGWPAPRTGAEGKLHPGADDNASGVAVLLELARRWGRGWRPGHTVLLVAFSGEEAGLLGSRRFVGELQARCLAAVNLDTVGRLGARKPLVLGSGSATEWVHVFRGIGWVTGVETTLVADDPGGSDQVAFHEAGIPAVQIFSGPHTDYHAPGDTPDRIDAAGLVKICTVVKEAVEYLAGRARPLTSTLRAGQRKRPAPAAGRKVSLGTIPDFAFRGAGVRLSGVVPGSPAAKAGLAAGDVVRSVKGRPTPDLRAYSRVLKSLQPGQDVTVGFERAGKPAQVTLKAEPR